MKLLRAFIGHSFNEEDKVVVAAFLNYFKSIEDIGFEWDHAERAQSKELAAKVKEKMEGKNVFIGIFTKKNRQIEKSNLTRPWFNNNKFAALEQDFHWTTSEWVIQESGYALGKDMSLIFLVESDLQDVGGLQGNLEYITFKRDNVSDCFAKLNEMITSLVKRKEVIDQQEANQKTAGSDTSSVTSETEKKGNDKDSSFGRMLDAFISHRAAQEQESAFKQLFQEKDNDYEKVEIKSFYQWLRYKYNNDDVFGEMLELATSNEAHPDPYRWLGTLYSEYNQFDKAHDYYLMAAEKEKTARDRTTAVVLATGSLIKAGKIEQARNKLIECLTSKSSEANYETSALYKGLAKEELKAGKLDQYFAMLEKTLVLKPGDSEIRFELAYAYLEHKKHDQSLYHFSILCDSHPSSSSFNNLGVSYSHFELDGKAVEAYLRSKELGGTTAVGNLANKLIDKGFLQMAKDMLSAALHKPDCDANVNHAMAKISDVVKQEDEKEKEIVTRLPKYVDFMNMYAEAYCDTSFKGTIPPKWKSTHGTISMVRANNKLSGDGLANSSAMTLSNIYQQQGLLGNQQPEDRMIHFEGEIYNRAINYSITVTKKSAEADKKATLANALLQVLPGEEESYSGLMIISPDLKKIYVRQENSKGYTRFTEMEPVE